MDAFIIAFRDLSRDLIPILGAACLVCVIILLIKLIKVLSSVDLTLVKIPTTIDLVDRSIEKVQAPLDTVAKVSETVDKAHDATLVAVKDAKECVAKNADDIKERVVAFINNNDADKKKELKEPSPEDIIGG